jgi:hypothetical protein
MTAPDWQALYAAERTARLDAEARLRGMRWTMALALYEAERAARLDVEARLRGLHWTLGGAILAAGVIAALCGALTAAEAASHAVAAHRQETSP